MCVSLSPSTSAPLPPFLPRPSVTALCFLNGTRQECEFNDDKGRIRNGVDERTDGEIYIIRSRPKWLPTMYTTYPINIMAHMDILDWNSLYIGHTGTNDINGNDKNFSSNNARDQSSWKLFRRTILSWLFFQLCISGRKQSRDECNRYHTTGYHLLQCDNPHTLARQGTCHPDNGLESSPCRQWSCQYRGHPVRTLHNCQQHPCPVCFLLFTPFFYTRAGSSPFIPSLRWKAAFTLRVQESQNHVSMSIFPSGDLCFILRVWIRPKRLEFPAHSFWGI